MGAQVKRGDCQGGPRPCPLVSCRHHLLWDWSGPTAHVHPEARAAVRGRPAALWTEDDVERALLALPSSCALDVADAGPATDDLVGVMVGCSGEAVRQEEGRLTRLLRGTSLLRQAWFGTEPLRHAPGRSEAPRLQPGQDQGELWGDV